MTQQKNLNPKRYKYVLVSVVLFLIILLLGSLAFIFSMRKIQHTNTGRELSQTVEIEKLKLKAEINGEIALILKMADSPMVRQYFLHPGDPDLKRVAIEELLGYRRVLGTKLIFWVSDIDKKFYLNNSYAYTVDLNSPDNSWYNLSLNGTEAFNFNINYHSDLKGTNFWINAPVFDSNHRPIGVVGTGINVSSFIDFVYRNYSGAASLFLFDKTGKITGAKDKNLVSNKTDLESELGKTGAVIFSMLDNLENSKTLYFNVPGGMVALGVIPEFDWYVCAILPVGLKETLKTSMTIYFIAMMAVIAAIFIIFNLIRINSELNRERNTYRDMSLIDALTGIYNRRFLEENLERTIKALSRSESKLSILMLDVDYFKKYNDTYGHNMGDTCLKAVANTLAKSIVRSDDFIARYGGEEFVVVLPNADEQGAKKVAERLLKNIRTLNIPHEKNDAASFVTVSIGGATNIVNHSHTVDHYFKRADEALYKSKQKGRNRYTAHLTKKDK